MEHGILIWNDCMVFTGREWMEMERNEIQYIHEMY